MCVFPPNNENYEIVLYFGFMYYICRKYMICKYNNIWYFTSYSTAVIHYCSLSQPLFYFLLYNPYPLSILLLLLLLLLLLCSMLSLIELTFSYLRFLLREQTSTWSQRSHSNILSWLLNKIVPFLLFLLFLTMLISVHVQFWSQSQGFKYTSQTLLL